MKHKTKNRLIKKRKGRKTRKTRRMKMRRGGSLFTSTEIGIPGLGSFGDCPDKQIYENGELKTQTCYELNGNKVYKTVENGANTKSWYFW